MSVDFNQGFEAGLRSCQQQMEGKIAELQAKLSTANSDIDRLNQMLRKTGYGQGQIDAYADECEARERCEQKLAALRAAAAPFTSVGRTLDEQLADHWCHHHDHFVGHYRELVQAIEALEPDSCT